MSDDSILQEETNVTDLTITVDGRVYIAGTSRPVIELLADLQPGNPRLAALLNHLRRTELDTKSQASRNMND